MPEIVKECKKLENLLKEVLTRTIDIWVMGEGDMSIEVRDDGGERKAKIKGGSTARIK